MAAAIGASSSLRVRASDSASATIALRASLVSRRAKAEHDLAALPAAERGAGEIKAEIDTLLISSKDLDPRGLGPCIDYEEIVIGALPKQAFQGHSVDGHGIRFRWFELGNPNKQRVGP